MAKYEVYAPTWTINEPRPIAILSSIDEAKSYVMERIANIRWYEPEDGSTVQAVSHLLHPLQRVWYGWLPEITAAWPVEIREVITE